MSVTPTKATLVALLLSIACSAQAKKIAIYERVDEFKGNTIYFTNNQQPKLEGGSFVSMRYVFVSFMALSPMTDSKLAYTVKIEATLPGWMFISNGESLVLKADDQVVKLSGVGSESGRDVTSLGVREVAYYSFPLSTLKQLAAAKSIQFRVYGDKGLLTGAFTERMMEELRFFAEQAPDLIKDPSASTTALPATVSSTSPSSPTQLDAAASTSEARPKP